MDMNKGNHPVKAVELVVAWSGAKSRIFSMIIRTVLLQKIKLIELQLPVVVLRILS